MRSDELEGFVQRCVKSYSDHVIYQESEERLVFRKPDSGILRVVFSDCGNGFGLWGDIDAGFFAYTSPESTLRQKIAWIGRSTSLRYVAEKWGLGMSIDAKHFCEHKASEDLETLRRETIPEWAKDMDEDKREAFLAKAEDACESISWALSDNNSWKCWRKIGDLFGDMEMAEGFGEIIRPRVIWSYAACIACVKLFEEESS